MVMLFKTVLILSLLGVGLITLLLLLKPIFSTKMSARWQYCLWILVLLMMVLPLYKLIPQQKAQQMVRISRTEPTQQALPPSEQSDSPQSPFMADNAPKKAGQSAIPKKQPQLILVLAWAWLGGMCLYLLVVFSSYGFYLAHKRRHAVDVIDNAVLTAVRHELNIRRPLRVRLSSECDSPMLVGVLFPIIYMPCRDLSETQMRMALLHELTHYKRKDLWVKWFSLFVSAVHWFNPLVYLLCHNLSEICEISCDMAVTKTMSEVEQTMYMKTILDLVDRR